MSDKREAGGGQSGQPRRASESGRGNPSVHPGVRKALRILRGLPGIVAVKQVQRQIVEQVVGLESRYEQGVLLPLKNLGVRMAMQRDVAFALLKDRHFREPPEPTVYLVEEKQRSGSADKHYLTLEGRTYRIVGEEVITSREPYLEKTISLGDSFVIFPERRSSDKTPSYFLVPPLGFPELEEVRAELGIEGVLSISPSAQADVCLREVCGFSPDPALATLLVAFDLKR
ncbi:MAG: hypothetical protein JSV89_04675 [Spirochaetaceae bacterium]|nr:MAG: hypothetical protein JSV89_04675 [Spirochaetaceae bacterium]